MTRDDRDSYRGDVWYEEYRRGLPEGSLSDDRIEDGYDSGVSPESLVNHEAQKRQDAARQRQMEEEYQELQWQQDQESSGEECQ